MSEKAVQDRIVGWLKKNEIWVTKVHGGPYQQAGLPDLRIIYRGRSIDVEVKDKGKKPTRLQMATMRKIAAAGGLVNWFDDSDKAIAWLRDRFRTIDSQSSDESS